MDERDKGRGSGFSINVEGKKLVMLEWDAGDSLFRAGTVINNDPRSLV